MKCKNCGAELPQHSNKCFNCGVEVEAVESFKILDDYVELDKGEDEKVINYTRRLQKRNYIINILILVLGAVLIVASGVISYSYFSNQNEEKEIPTISFTSGCGIINDDERVAYATFNDSESIQYIHGVTLCQVSGDVAQDISTDYEYTENIDGSFRVIYFDMDKLDLPSDENTYFFKVDVSFYSDENIYSYTQDAIIDTNTTTDVSDIVFDHTLRDAQQVDVEEEKLKNPEASTTSPQETINDVSTGFIYNSFWFANPVKDVEKYYVTAYQFKQNGDCITTQYAKEGEGAWKTTTATLKYVIEGNTLVIKDDSSSEDEAYNIDDTNKALVSQTDNQNLEARRYNSVKNAEDFFGL